MLLIEPGDARVDGTAWRAEIVLVHGHPISCEVRRITDGQSLLSGPQAIRALELMGALSWELEEQEGETAPLSSARPFSSAGYRETPPSRLAGQPPSTVKAVPPGPSGPEPLVPRRTPLGDRWGISPEWPREYRQVFALVDGHRTISGIATLLRKRPGEVEHILLALQAQGVIERQL